MYIHRWRTYFSFFLPPQYIGELLTGDIVMGQYTSRVQTSGSWGIQYRTAVYFCPQSSWLLVWCPQSLLASRDNPAACFRPRGQNWQQAHASQPPEQGSMKQNAGHPHYRLRTSCMRDQSLSPWTLIENVLHHFLGHHSPPVGKCGSCLPWFF